jgi:hypothetical protein
VFAVCFGDGAAEEGFLPDGVVGEWWGRVCEANVFFLWVGGGDGGHVLDLLVGFGLDVRHGWSLCGCEGKVVTGHDEE